MITLSNRQRVSFAHLGPQTKEAAQPMLPRETAEGKDTSQLGGMWGLSRGLPGVHLVDVLVGGGGEVELLRRDPVVTGAAESQCPLEVQQLAHEVEVGGDVGFLHLDNVISIVH